MSVKIALCGNPNVGKTTLFNRITRSDAPVGNWHGVTVDVRTEKVRARIGGSPTEFYISDLPGAYSLCSVSADEHVTRNAVTSADHDVIVYVAEVNNLRRNLYMLVQLLELGKTCVLAVNMLDEANGEVKLDLLSARLGIPVVGTAQTFKNPKDDILAAAMTALSRAKTRKAKDGGAPAETCPDCLSRYDCNAVRRYEFIDRALAGVLPEPKAHPRTLRADKILLGKLAIPVFLLVMSAVFIVTFEAGRPLSDLLLRLNALIAAPVRSSDMPDYIISLICDGIISGVGSVLAFMPQVVILFLFTSILQDSGYMSRVAFATDGFFKRFGLNGRAAFSLILGLGCSVTAVLSSRGIADRSTRNRAAFIVPFCPCSARLAVFTAIAAYFELSGIAVAAVYVAAFAVALVVLKIMRVADKRPDEQWLMEMPPYRVPNAKRIARSVLSSTGSFVARVGSVILCASVIMWTLCNFSMRYGFGGGADNSLMRTLADFLAPAFKPLGFGSWRAVAALISGIAAKETVISTIAALGGWNAVLGGSTASAVSFMLFTALYVPCIATVSAIAKELGLKYALLSVATHTLAAYAASLIVYQCSVLYAYDARAFFAAVFGAIGVAALAVTATALIKKHSKRTRKDKTEWVKNSPSPLPNKKKQ